MLAMLLLLVYYFFVEMRSIKISAEELANNYSNDVTTADEKFLNKEIELSGKVKAYFKFEDEDDLLELFSGNSTVNVYCMLINEDQSTKANKLTQGTEVKVLGKCLGLAEYKFPNSIYFKVSKLKWNTFKKKYYYNLNREDFI